MNAPDLADVLAEVNRLRDEREMDPLDAMPKGRECDSNQCPLARALGVAGVVPGYVNNDPADIGHYRFDGESAGVPLPLILCQFGRYFDRGAYPELVA